MEFFTTIYHFLIGVAGTFLFQAAVLLVLASPFLIHSFFKRRRFIKKYGDNADSLRYQKF